MATYLTNCVTEKISDIVLSKDTDKSTQLYITDRTDLINSFSNAKADKTHIQIPASFDIETTSFRKDDRPYGTMYIWQFAFKFEQKIIFVYGRTWAEWENFLITLKACIKKKKIVIYVHNLSFEFHWIFTHLYLTKVFARKAHHPIYAECDNIIFRCSYFLTNQSLKDLASSRGYTEKENYDYSLIRHYATVLTPDEISYALVDVKILVEFIDDEIERNGKVQSIPLTSTGYVRRYCINYISEHTNFSSYRSQVQQIIPDEIIFGMLHKAFAGGFTHANYKYVDVALEDVHCFDRTSYYPSMMCTKRFPRGFRKAKPEKLHLYNGMAQLMQVNFTELKAKTSHSIISLHKCEISEKEKSIIDNGRVRYATSLRTTITDLDLEVIRKFYTFERMEIEVLYVAKYDYLPRELIMSVLELYQNKTTLKGVVGQEKLYMLAKALLNAVYGMSVTNPLNDDIIFDGEEWSKVQINTEEGLEKYRNGYNLFTAYQWGVWVTAWARHDLLMNVYEIGDDARYSDTDSIKFVGNHFDVFERANKITISEIEKVIKYYKLNRELFYPKNIKGMEMPLGVWDREADYKYFKTLGAKRYCFSYTDEYFEKVKDDLKTDINFFVTVSGISKTKAKEYIMRLADKNDESPFNLFGYEKYMKKYDFLTIPAEYTGKLASYYSKPDDAFKMELTDYQGNKVFIFERSFINLSAVPFQFNLSDDFDSFLKLMNHYSAKTGSFNERRIDFIRS